MWFTSMVTALRTRAHPAERAMRRCSSLRTEVRGVLSPCLARPSEYARARSTAVSRLSVFIALWGPGTPLRLQGMVGWFGVRGIGSLYCLMVAIEHGLPEPVALLLTQITLIVITMSILLHGISVEPMMGAFWRRK